MFVPPTRMNGSFWGLLQSEWLLIPTSGKQFVFIVLEFQEYNKEKCTSHTMTPGEQFVFSRHYYFIVHEIITELALLLLFYILHTKVFVT